MLGEGDLWHPGGGLGWMLACVNKEQLTTEGDGRQKARQPPREPGGDRADSESATDKNMPRRKDGKLRLWRDSDPARRKFTSTPPSRNQYGTQISDNVQVTSEPKVLRNLYMLWHMPREPLNLLTTRVDVCHRWASDDKKHHPENHKISKKRVLILIGIIQLWLFLLYGLMVAIDRKWNIRSWARDLIM